MRRKTLTWPESDGSLRGFRIACRPAGRGARFVGSPAFLLRGSQSFSAEDVTRLRIDIDALVEDQRFVVEKFDEGNRAVLLPGGSRLEGTDAIRHLHRLIHEDATKRA